MKSKGQLLLGVNIDHVATIRQARMTSYPDPVVAALEAQRAGADGITLHVREDRRHVNERDLERLMEMCQIPVNLEMAASEEMLMMAKKHKPPFCCIVPEKREELTTEGGLDVVKHFSRMKEICMELNKQDCEVSLFVDPSISQIEASFEAGATFIEIHTGFYADAIDARTQAEELVKIQKAAKIADEIGLKVNAGHGLHLHNTLAIAKIPEIIELNIGHSLVGLAITEGMQAAVRQFKMLLAQAR